MLRREKSLSELVESITLLPQVLLNVKTNHAAALAKQPTVLKHVESLTYELNNKGRILLRPSGTEPLLRIMVEGDDHQRITHYANQLRDTVLQVERELE